jgi:amino acid adenylation domain-containing protein
VLLGRSVNAVVALIGILRSGATYVPLDRNAPRGRLEQLVVDAGLRAVITDADAIDLPDVPSLRIAEIPSRPSPEIAYLPAGAAAYVIHTSGSSGRPKGVVVEHRALNNFLRWARTFCDPRPHDRFLQHAPHTVDASLCEIMTPLTGGATVRLITEDQARDPRELSRLLRDDGITHVDLMASVLAVLEPPGSTTLRYCATGGERVPAALVNRWACPGRVVANTYGPTEVAELSVAAVCDLPTKSDPPIGRAIPNVRAYVLDDQLEPRPAGAIGELFLAGESLARGYLGAPAETARRFLPDPFVDGERMYRTGDLVRVQPDGNIDYVGRGDRQLKVSGHRVEPEEVERVLGSIDGVEQCVVVGVDRPDLGHRLVAFVVGFVVGLREQAIELLPSFMVPSRFVPLDQLPVLASGKVDIELLQALASRALPPQELSDAPGDRFESAVLAAARSVIGRDVGLDERVLDAGVDSLDVMRMLALLQRDLSQVVSVQRIAGANSLRELASTLRLVEGLHAEDRQQ